MSRRFEVLTAVKAMCRAALPGARVIGLDGAESTPIRVEAGGLVVVRSGDPGEPEVDLCPVIYHYDHRIPIEVVAYESGGRTSEEALDDMLGAIGAAIVADRSLGGLCDWLDAAAPETEDIYEEGALPPRGTSLNLMATYATTTPC